MVAIEYSPKTYSILYRDSVNLDEKGGEIHRNYNQWIDNLDRAIRVQLEKL